MTFAEYWAENEPFGSNPEDVAELAWDAANAMQRERLEKCEAALRTIAHGIGMDHLKPRDVPAVMQDVARAALGE